MTLLGQVPNINITVWRGMVTDVDLPEGWTYTVEDLDEQEAEDEQTKC